MDSIIAELRSTDNGTVRWTPPENLHLTLRFLGELPTGTFREARQLLTEREMPSRCRLRFTGIDAFPSLRKPQVIVLGLEGITQRDQTELLQLQSLCEAFARELGLEPEDRTFRPHLTLGRVRRDRRIPEALRTALTSTRPELPQVEVEHLLLVESFLSREGARYRVAEKRELGSW